jgi:hypothetical protein
MTARTFRYFAVYGSEGGLRLLDGGPSEWEGEGFEFSATAVTPEDVSCDDTATDRSLRVVKDWVLDRLDDDVVYFDVRLSSECADGHIPGAQNVNGTDNLASGLPLLPAADTLGLDEKNHQSSVMVRYQSRYLGRCSTGQGWRCAYMTGREMNGEQTPARPRAKGTSPKESMDVAFLRLAVLRSLLRDLDDSDGLIDEWGDEGFDRSLQGEGQSYRSGHAMNVEDARTNRTDELAAETGGKRR